MTPEQHDQAITRGKAVIDWIAAVLGLGTIAGLVNIAVGVLSTCWLSYQLYVAIVYELPIKRARLQAIRDGRRDPEPTDRSPLL